MATIVSVGSVYSPGFIASISGGVVSGDGHVCLGVPAGQFGTPIPVVPPQAAAAGGVASAQSFGAIKTRIVVAVVSASTAQSFGAVSFRQVYHQPVDGLSSEQAFGAPTVIRASVHVLVGAVASAQAFGAPRFKFSLQFFGVPSAQSFGALSFQTRVSLGVVGVGSAQQFGVLLGRVFDVYDRPSECLSSPEAAICGFPICGEYGLVCGGLGYLGELDCLTSQSPTICNQFLVGQRLLGGAAFIDELDCGDLDLVDPADLIYDLQPASSLELDLTPAGCL